MDTSEQYIKMCDCEEIQGQSPELTLFHKTEESSDIFYDKGNVWFGELIDAELHKVWLPRQDQLQEIMSINRGNIFTGLTILNQFIEESTVYSMIGWSMEQLWLAFVMKEKYNKAWNGENWTGG